jgi:glycosyltransferase involved in cell wall biosynthesis
VENVSVIVPLSSRPEEARQVLDSVDAAAAFLHAQPEGQGVALEVVIVDDGSHPETRPMLEEWTRGRRDHHLLLRGGPTNRACACNLGVSHSAGDLLFFLDGDGLFLENHLLEGLKVFLAQPEIDFVKSRVELSDAVHPEWVTRIANSLIINLGVRRRCHERVGGFPDQHVFRRAGNRFEHELDIFDSIEGVFYNMKLASASHGRTIVHPTVRYLRRPGNTFDRQYDRFQLEPGPGHVRGDGDECYELRVSLAKALIDHEIAAIRCGRDPYALQARRGG